MSAGLKSLGEMTAEVVANCKRLGWYDDERTFGEVMAMLHSEALEAWRTWGLADATDYELEAWNETRPKPEGVGSEFADIFIRLLDDCHRFGIDLEAEAARHVGAYGVYESFPENINALHTLIARASEQWNLGQGGTGPYLTHIYIFLRQLCEEYGIDLFAEYERKAAYNKTRSFKHGGKPI